MKVVIDIPEEIMEYIKNNGCLSVIYTDEVAKAIINGTPYEERPQGEWIGGEYQDCHSDILPEYTCPFCGEVAYKKYDFCHWCGADMRGETSNE